MLQDTIIQNIQSLRSQLQEHAMDPACPPLLLPVTKMRPVSDILALRQAGVLAVGENRVQEIMEKYPDLSAAFAIHLIGRLQTNKIKYIIGRVSMVQSLDRLELARALDARAQAAGCRMPVLVEVNIGGETQKAGVSPETAEAFVRACGKLPGLAVRGLMAIMPLSREPEELRPLFRSMRQLFVMLRAQAIDGVEMQELSMGMSGDFRVAAQEGATIVRVGSAIFQESVAVTPTA